QRGASLRTEPVDQADPALSVTKADQVLAEELDVHGRAIGLRQLPREQGRDPAPAHGGPHRRSGTNAGDELVFFVSQHESPSSLNAALHGAHQNVGRIILRTPHPGRGALLSTGSAHPAVTID